MILSHQQMMILLDKMNLIIIQAINKAPFLSEGTIFFVHIQQFSLTHEFTNLTFLKNRIYDLKQEKSSEKNPLLDNYIFFFKFLNIYFEMLIELNKIVHHPESDQILKKNISELFKETYNLFLADKEIRSILINIVEDIQDNLPDFSKDRLQSTSIFSNSYGHRFKNSLKKNPQPEPSATYSPQLPQSSDLTPVGDNLVIKNLLLTSEKIFNDSNYNLNQESLDTLITLNEFFLTIQNRLKQSPTNEIKTICVNSGFSNVFTIQRKNREDVFKIIKTTTPHFKNYMHEYDIHKTFNGNPYIVQTLGLNPFGNVIYLEYLPKGDLNTYLKNANGGVSSEILESFSFSVMKAISVLHQFDVIHGDIKSANFLITDDFFLKLSDFNTSIPPGKDLTNTGLTPTMAAPELVQSKRTTGEYQHTKMSDVWSEMLLLCCLIVALPNPPPSLNLSTSQKSQKKWEEAHNELAKTTMFKQAEIDFKKLEIENKKAMDLLLEWGEIFLREDKENYLKFHDFLSQEKEQKISNKPYVDKFLLRAKFSFYPENRWSAEKIEKTFVPLLKKK